MPSAASTAFAHFLQFRIQYASIALVYYDYALTFPAEVKYIWKQKFHMTNIPYVCCRYALVANVIYVLAQMHKLGNRFVCDAWYVFDGVISVLGRAALIVTFSLRTYALSGCNKVILGCIGSIGLTCVVLDIMHVPGLKCVGSKGFAEAPLAILMCVFEFLTLTLTAWYSMHDLRVGSTWTFSASQIQFVIFRQGILYYCFVSIFTISASVLQFKATPGTFLQRLPNAFTLPFSCLLTARFILQLRALQHGSLVFRENGEARGHSLDVTTGVEMGSAQFAGAVTTLQAATPPSTTRSAVDSIVMRHFGDGDALYSQDKGKEKDGDLERSGVMRDTDSEIRIQGGGGQSVHSFEGDREHENTD